MIPIKGFRYPYRWLSNFEPVVIMLDSEAYPTVEHAYQAAKTIDAYRRSMIRAASSPGQAKRIGHKFILRPGWEEMKIDVMKQLIRQKFEDKNLRQKLLDTGDAQLIEDNWWGDMFWGVYKDSGENHLGKIIMEVREEIKNSQKPN